MQYKICFVILSNYNLKIFKEMFIFVTYDVVDFLLAIFSEKKRRFSGDSLRSTLVLIYSY